MVKRGIAAGIPATVSALVPSLLLLALLPGLVNAGITLISDKELSSGAIEVRECNDGQPLGTPGCDGEYIGLTPENFHGAKPVPGTVGMSATDLYTRVAYSPYVRGSLADGQNIQKYLGVSMIDYVTQANVKYGDYDNIQGYTSQWTGTYPSINAFDLLRPYNVFRVGQGTETLLLAPFRLKGKWEIITPATCAGVTGKDTYLFDSQGGACIPGKQAPKLPGGMQDVAVSEDMIGKSFSALKGDCEVKAAWGASNPKKAFSQKEGTWVKLYDSSTITEDMAGSGIKLYTTEGRECTLATKGYPEKLGKASNLAAGFKSGYNLISVSKSMAGKSFEDFKGTCTFEKILYYFPQLCAAANLRDPNSVPQVCGGSSSDYAIISPNTKLNELYLGKAFWVKVTSDCKLAADPEAASPSPCTAFGVRSEKGEYCSIPDAKWKAQKDALQQCEHNFECKTNLCINNRCISEAKKNEILKILA